MVNPSAEERGPAGDDETEQHRDGDEVVEPAQTLAAAPGDDQGEDRQSSDDAGGGQKEPSGLVMLPDERRVEARDRCSVADHVRGLVAGHERGDGAEPAKNGEVKAGRDEVPLSPEE